MRAGRCGLIAAVKTTDRRNDTGLGQPMLDEVARRFGRLPRRVLFDKGYAAQSDIVALDEHPLGPVAVYAPLPAEKPEADLKPASLANRQAKRAKEPQPVQAWRARMDSEEGHSVFRRRKLIERLNAHFKNRGFDRLTVTGRLKTQAVALWHALANNLMLAHRLRTPAAQPA